MFSSFNYALCIGVTGTNTANLTIITNALTVMANLGLFTIWIQLMRRYTGERKAKVIRFTAYGLLLLLILFSIITCIGSSCIDPESELSYDNCDDCTAFNAMLIIWYITLGISIAANLSQVCLAFIFIFFLHPEENAPVRRSLIYLFLSFLLLLLNNFGILFDNQILNIFPYLLSHHAFISMCGSVIRFIQEEKRRQEQEQRQDCDNNV
jgi:hypothetical protein